MICWYCYWGWPAAVVAVYKDALNELGGHPDPLLYGPAGADFVKVGHGHG